MADVSGGRSVAATPDAKCGRCGHFWDWHGKRDNGACKGAYLMDMSMSPCACTARPPVCDATELQRLADDPEIMEAVEVLRLSGVNGAVYNKLIQRGKT